MNYLKAGYTAPHLSKRVQQAMADDHDSHQQMSESLIVAKATFLARNGRLNHAATLLLPIANKENSPISTLDLLAKVYAQQGRINEAKTLWLRALRRDPSNKHFLQAIRCCEGLYGNNIWDVLKLRIDVLLSSLALISLIIFPFLNMVVFKWEDWTYGMGLLLPIISYIIIQGVISIVLNNQDHSLD